MYVVVTKTAFSSKIVVRRKTVSFHRLNSTTNRTDAIAITGMSVYASASAAPICARWFTVCERWSANHLATLRSRAPSHPSANTWTIKAPTATAITVSTA